MRRPCLDLIFTWLAALLLAGCASLPPLDGRAESHALGDTGQTRLGRAIAPGIAAHPGQSGIHALAEPHDAFAARVLLAASADRSLDVQYYIWHRDQTGELLFEALWQAAERGVRVRLLLDDANTGGIDPTIAALDAHPNIEVRLYNPFAQRSLRLLNFVSDFSRVNRRMHNKSFTADNQASIVGGRNIGNEYFGAGQQTEFADLDVLAVGAAVPAISRQFDDYWNSASAYPAASLLGSPGEGAAEGLRAEFAAARADPESTRYLEALRSTRLVQDLLGERLPLEWTRAQLVYDDPAKTLAQTPQREELLLPALLATIGHPQTELDLVSPYFVPGKPGTESLVALAGRGVRLRILTNSLAASDVGAVHAGYAKWREPLLRAGVQLYEFKPTQLNGKKGDKGSSAAKDSHGSSAALHAKTFAVDRQRIFVGSFNFDPRSALLNTEMGLVIDSPGMAQRLSGLFDQELRRIAYTVRLAGEGDALVWTEAGPEGEQQFSVEPETGWLRRVGIQFLSILPIDWLL
ncbi:phospholipase D family protein [Roseateles violae]|uniref:Phospholipase D family protein n=1 Tax=Roseateles violae TaxID=3058042 RepID=A0ABT8DPT9_9BURK|nr:phospholipase D family protein [Pelomonas sp. PFR6]MDN3920365.1 phospholipase D family protein [Pelomonas sp. PFR6]